MFNTTGRKCFFLRAVSLFLLFSMFETHSVNAEIDTTTRSYQEKKGESSVFNALTLMVEWVGQIETFISKEVDKANRRKLLNRLWILADHLSEMESRMHSLSQSLKDAKTYDNERVQSNLTYLGNHFKSFGDEVNALRSAIQITVPQGAGLERDITIYTINHSSLVDQLILNISPSGKRDIEIIQPETDRLIELSHKTQDAIIKLCEKLK